MIWFTGDLPETKMIRVFSFNARATSVIMRVDVKIVIITLVAYARRHYNATSVMYSIFTSTCIITLVACVNDSFSSPASLW